MLRHICATVSHRQVLGYTRNMNPYRGIFSAIIRSTFAIIVVLIFGFVVYNKTVINPLRARTWSVWVREPLARPSELAQCSAHPETWMWKQNGEIYAYDAQTGQSKNPAAPPLRRHLLEMADERTREDGMGLELDDSTTHWTSWAVWRTGLEGDCSVFQYRLSVLPKVEWDIAEVLIVFVFVGAIVTVILVYALMTHPIVSALHRLRLTAGGVGTTAFTPFAPTRDDEIGEVGRVLETAHLQILADRKQILHARSALERFMADVAHDVRTPIAAIQLNLDALRGHPDPEVRATIGRSLGDIVYLGSLTQNLRLAARLGGEGEPEGPPETFDLEALVNQVTERQRPFATHRSIHLDVLSAGEPLWVSGNPTYTEQAITNLVQNALSYGKEGGEVIVSLTSEDGTFELLVEDDGPGVAPEELPRLTERYFRAGDERSRQKPGSGLGLSIAQRVCERAGWKLVLAQAEPSGLAIRIRGRTASPLG